MYVFSAQGKAREAHDDIAKGQKALFIVYINFQDLFGAEQLCKIYLMKSGFTEIEIEKRKLIDRKLLTDERVLAADKALQEAVNDGYMIQMFDE